jgi:predicted dehydrogenase
MPPAGQRGNLWEIEGTNGALVGNELWLEQNGSRRLYPFQWEWTEAEGAKVLDHVRVDTDPPVVWENPFKRYAVADNDEVARVDILIGFHRAVTQAITPDYPPERAWRDQEIWIALRESALRGNTWVELPLTEVTRFEQMMQEEYLRLYGRCYDDLEGLTRVRFPRGGVRWTVGQQL